MEDRRLWERVISAFLLLAACAAAAGTLYLIWQFLTDRVRWIEAAIDRSWDGPISRNQIHVVHAMSSLTKRTVVIFAGLGIAFIGLMLSWYTNRRLSRASASYGDFAFKIASASPGIIAMILGACLLATATLSKDHFESAKSDPPRNPDRSDSPSFATPPAAPSPAPPVRDIPTPTLE